MKKKLTGKDRANKFATGGTAIQIAKQAPQILDSIIGLFESNPNAYSTQPTLNASTMKQMVTPYSKFGMGGQFDEETMAQLQQMAEENDMTVEELIQQLQSGGQSEEETPDETMAEDGEEEDIVGSDDVSQFAYGGMMKKSMFAMGGVPIEVEGNEVLQTPDGSLSKVKGVSHEAGGVNVNVPKGTKIYSDRLEIDGKTMQQRKLSRERGIKRIQKLIDANPSDKILQSTYKRTLATTQQEEQQDMALQKMMNKIYNGQPVDMADMKGQEEFAMGGKVMYAYGDEIPYFDKTGWKIPNTKSILLQGGQDLLDEDIVVNQLNKTLLPGLAKKQIAAKDNNPATTIYTSDPLGENYQPEVTDKTGKTDTSTDEFTGKPTLGDFIGIGGNLFNAVAPLAATLKNAKGNKPNINRFRGFGQKAIDTNEKAQGAAATLKAEMMTDIDTAANTARLRARNSASSVNTVRALDAVTDIGTGKSKQAANDSFTKTMIGLFGQRGQLENLQDQMEMKGEAQRDIEDKADRDNFYSNLSQNLVNLGTNVQGVGKSLNIKKSNQIDAKLISQLSQYGLGFDDEGNLISTKKNK